MVTPMEDLWKVKALDWGLPDMADAAEYQRLVNRYHKEEQQENMRHLMFPEGEKNESPAKK